MVFSVGVQILMRLHVKKQGAGGAGYNLPAKLISHRQQYFSIDKTARSARSEKKIAALIGSAKTKTSISAKWPGDGLCGYELR
jgi:hypothetical protein